MIRYCDCPAPENGGADCSGNSKTTRICSREMCKNKTEDGQYCFSLIFDALRLKLD